VELPAGVVAQPILELRSQPGVLKLSHRYPITLFHKRNVLDAYRDLVHVIERTFEERRRERARREDQQQNAGYWDRTVSKYDAEATETCLELCAILFDQFEVFRDANIEIAVCHRRRLDLVHQPVVDRWLEFIDRQTAPADYRSVWSMTTTILLPLCSCVKTNELLAIYMPGVGLLKLFPFSTKGVRQLPVASERLRNLIMARGLTADFEELLIGLSAVQARRNGFWNPHEVEDVVKRASARFAARGMAVHFCQLLCIPTVERLFQWIEFVNLNDFPAYEPQYRYKADTPVGDPGGKSDPKIRVDSVSGERYFTSWRLEKLRRKANRLRSSSCLPSKRQPPVNWYTDDV